MHLFTWGAGDKTINKNDRTDTFSATQRFRGQIDMIASESL